jgi:hypothetical protein
MLGISVFVYNYYIKVVQITYLIPMPNSSLTKQVDGLMCIFDTDGEINDNDC